MKHKLLTSAAIVAALAALPTLASAQITPRSTGLEQAAAGGGLATGCSGAECIATIVGQAINIVLGFLGVVLLCMFLYAGFLWMTAGGDMDNVKRAKQMITNAIAGLAVVAVSYALTTFILGQLATVAGGGGATSEAGGSAVEPGSVPTGGACTASSDCSDPLATCESGVCTSVIIGE